MAGGTFDKLAGKVRPGTYINFESTRQDTVNISERGTVIVPLAKHTWGPSGEFLSISAAAPDAEIAKLGFSIYDNDDNRQMLLIREALKKASTVLAYRVNTGTKAAASLSGITATAAYGGTRGNALTFAILQNPVADFDLEIYLDGSRVVLLEGISTVEEMNDNDYIVFTGSPSTTVTHMETTTEYIDFLGDESDNPVELNLYELVNGEYVPSTDTTYDESKDYYDAVTTTTTSEETAAADLPLTAGVNLTGGTDIAATNAAVTTFLDALEGVKFNAVAFPFTDATIQTAAKSKIVYMREDMGKGVQVAMPDTLSGDHEGVVNVTNSVKVGDISLTHAEACAWVAGACAGASYIQSNTYVAYEGATEIVDPKSHEQAVAGIKNGEFFFSISEAGAVVVEYDINSLVTFKKPKDKTYRKNRVIRVFDRFQEAVQLNFPPNTFSNDELGWDVMEGIGRSILKQFADAGAITAVEYGEDFLVDRSLSSGDETYFNIGLQPVDSSEKLYFTVKTR